MRYAKIRAFDIANGYGVRTTLFVSGCSHKCEGCFNVEAQSFSYGEIWNEDIEKEFMSYVNNPNIVGVNILGGEPLEQDNSLDNLLIRIKKETNKNIWLWSGYTYEEIINSHKKLKTISLVDVLVDGRFILKERDLMLKFRGSRNQRVIDVKKSLKENKLILLNI